MYSKNMVGWTKAQKLRIERVLALGCAICGHDNHGSKLEVDHLVEGNRRLGHQYTICLCSFHHRGTPPQLVERPVTLVDGSKLFVQAYGSRRSLWEATQRRLGLPCNWPESKLVPRKLIQESHDVWD
jgi:Recombination enhancement, RecA-dependent nuclease